MEQSYMNGSNSTSYNSDTLPPPPPHILALTSCTSELSLCSESPYQMPPPPPHPSDCRSIPDRHASESIVPPPMPIITPPTVTNSVTGALSLSTSKSSSNSSSTAKSSPPIAVPPRISSCATSSSSSSTNKPIIRSTDHIPVSIMKSKNLPPLQIQNKLTGHNEKSVFSNIKEISYCNICGQMHNPASNHIYTYTSPVLSELICQICNNPLVDPLQTKCSHTFCAACLKMRLATNAMCPEDHQIINYLECSPAANIVKSLLDKLTIYCPNDSCKEKLQRCDLEAHLLYWCHSNKLQQSSHSNKWSSSSGGGGCVDFEKSPHTTSTTVTLSSTNSDPPMIGGGPPTSSSNSTVVCPISNGENNSQDVIGSLSSPSSSDVGITLSGGSSSKNSGTAAGGVSMGNKATVRFESMSQTRVKYYSSSEDSDVLSGAVTTVIIERASNVDLGISFVGGYDTPLQCIIIQEIYLDGAVAKDGRLRPGDQIISINDINLNQATHLQARNIFLQIQQSSSSSTSSIRMTIFREKASLSSSSSCTTTSAIPSYIDDSFSEKQIYEFNLSKRIDKKLGIKLVGQKNKPGLYVLDLVKGSEADLDGRLRKNDRILSINDVDLTKETQDTAARVINNAEEEVKIVVARTVRAPIPDVIKNAANIQTNDHSAVNDAFFNDPLLGGGQVNNCFNYMELIRKNNGNSNLKEKKVQIEKSQGESLGMSVAGGIASQRGDTPVYVTNLIPDGVAAKSHAIYKGDILLRVNDTDLVGLTHDRAVAALKSAGKHCRHVTVHCLSGPETASGAGGPNFLPSWVYWLQLPRKCEVPRTVVLRREAVGLSLGFSIVGGADPAQQQQQQMSPSRHPQNGRYISSTNSNCSNSSNSYSTYLQSPIVIKSIVIGSVAHRNGCLKCGDILLRVNKTSLTNVTHDYAVNLFKNVQDEVELLVVSWPGTIV